MNTLHHSRITVIVFGALQWVLNLLHDMQPVIKDFASILTLLLAARHCYLAYRRKRGPRRSQSRLPLIIAALLLCLAVQGCTLLKSVTYDPQTGQPTTRLTAVTLWDSSSVISKLSNRSQAVSSNQWSPGTYIGNMEAHSASDTNLYSGLGTILGTALKAAK